MTTIHHCAETGSTNDDARALAEAGAGEGVWVRADRQTGGRGRMGRAWESPPAGNVYASTIVRVRPGDPAAPTLALVAAVALEELVAAYAGADGLRIKWPNDLLLEGAKLSGILLERAGDAVVIGFGVNLAHHPAGLVPTTDLASARAVAIEPAPFVEELAAAFARWLARWRGEGLGPVRARWLERAHAPGTPLVARLANGTAVEGLFDGLDAGGALLLRGVEGVRVVHAGDVFLL